MPWRLVGGSFMITATSGVIAALDAHRTRRAGFRTGSTICAPHRGSGGQPRSQGGDQFPPAATRRYQGDLCRHLRDPARPRLRSGHADRCRRTAFRGVVQGLSRHRRTGRCHRPLKAAANGAPGRIRTCDPEIRNLVLYPAELRARWASYSKTRVAETGESGVAAAPPIGGRAGFRNRSGSAMCGHPPASPACPPHPARIACAP